MKAKCPICRKPVDYGRVKNSPKQQWLPFCSERCKLIDLGKWLDSDYRIPAEPEPSEEEEEEEAKDPTLKDDLEDI